VRPAPAGAEMAGTEVAGMRERLGAGDRAVALTVATNLAHKNLPALFDALALIAPGERPLLALAGHGTDDEQLRERARAAGVDDDVRLLGTLSTQQLDSLYASAALLVLPSLHEGFGLPVLEAMARSLPVACSDIGALREVGGEAAIYFDPRSADQIAAAISRLLSDGDLAARLREQGPVRAAGFSWSAAATATLASYTRTLSGRDPAR
jgi:glycosyltransferase involved in cell wall biosynthesis